MSDKKYLPGLTPRSFVAIIFSVLLMGMYIQFAEVILGTRGAPAEQSLPVQALLIFLMVSLLSGVFCYFCRMRLLSKQELLCVLFAMLLSAPMMTQGMWHRFIGLITAAPRSGAFDYIDAYNDKLWPHGKNIFAGAFKKDNSNLGEKGQVTWQEIEYEENKKAVLPILYNQNNDEISSIQIKIPIDAADFKLTEPHMISFLASAEKLGPESFVFCRTYSDDNPNFGDEPVHSRQGKKITFLHKKGFVRMGAYAINFEKNTQKHVLVEFGIKGAGKVSLADPKLFTVSAVVDAYKGKKIIPETEYVKLPMNERAGLIPKPDNMWSVKGLSFLIRGYIPLEDWIQPAITWSSFIFLILAATYAINIIMRKQWCESERFSFPLFRIPHYLLGEDEEFKSSMPPIWKNSYMWGGFVFALSYALIKGWNYYNPAVPDIGILVPLKPYFNDPGWGTMWNTTFTVGIFWLSICMFFELNILMSFIIGFAIFRSLYWAGEFANLKIYSGYPFRYELAIGSYLAYSLVIVFFARKYLFGILMSAVKGDKKEHGEIMSYRMAIILLLLSFVGASIWATYLGVSISSILTYFSFLVIIGLVASKLRAECGIPNGYFTPYNAMIFMSLTGGITAFGSEGVMFCLVASGFLTVSVFFFIPGAQLELIEYGKRFQITPRHITYTCLLGLAGGLFVGGWAFLSNSYALGGDNITYQWAYGQEWFVNKFRNDLNSATADLLRTEIATSAAASDSGLAPVTWAYIFSGGLTILVSVLRQIFSGFWFHPIGIILGSAHMIDWVWGSILTAWFIRWFVLKLGGAVTVKSKLQPFFVGAFVGSITSCLIFDVYAMYQYSQGVTDVYTALP